MSRKMYNHGSQRREVQATWQTDMHALTPEATCCASGRHYDCPAWWRRWDATPIWAYITNRICICQYSVFPPRSIR